MLRFEKAFQQLDDKKSSLPPEGFDVPTSSHNVCLKQNLGIIYSGHVGSARRVEEIANGKCKQCIPTKNMEPDVAEHPNGPHQPGK